MNVCNGREEWFFLVMNSFIVKFHQNALFMFQFVKILASPPPPSLIPLEAPPVGDHKYPLLEL